MYERENFSSLVAHDTALLHCSLCSVSSMKDEGVSTFATPRTLLHGRVEAARAAAHVAQEEVAAHLADDSHDDDKEVSKEAASTHLGQVQETQEAGGQQPGGPWRHHGSLITCEVYPHLHITTHRKYIKQALYKLY